MSVAAIKGELRELRRKLTICLPHDRFTGKGEIDCWIEETVAFRKELAASGIIDGQIENPRVTALCQDGIRTSLRRN